MFDVFTLIAGPCALEDDSINLRIANALMELGDRVGLPIVFKGSFDKANRSRGDAPRGPGLHAGLARLETVRRETGLPVITDVHETQQIEAVASVADALQIPAFLCRQTDLVRAAGASGLPVNIKKGQWMAPEEMAGATEKARSAGSPSVAVTERGAAHGYGDLVVDMRSFARLRAAAGGPAFFDGTHAVQRSGRAGGASGGDREHIPALVRAAVAAGCDGLFLEVHPDPASAPSDRATMLPLDRLDALVGDVLRIRNLAPFAEDTR